MARARHQRTTPLLTLLARLGWQRDPGPWTVRCRDQYGRRAQVQVHLTETRIRIATSSPEPLDLTPSTPDPEADDHHRRDTGVAA